MEIKDKTKKEFIQSSNSNKFHNLMKLILI